MYPSQATLRARKILIVNDHTTLVALRSRRGRGRGRGRRSQGKEERKTLEVYLGVYLTRD